MVAYRALNTIVLTAQCLVSDIINLTLRSFVVAPGSEIKDPLLRTHGAALNSRYGQEFLFYFIPMFVCVHEWPASCSVRISPGRTGVGICWIVMSGAQIQSGCDKEISSLRKIRSHIPRPAALSV
jgi:hypothetical protein